MTHDTNPPSEHFGWPSYYDDEDAYARRDAERQREVHRLRREQAARATAAYYTNRVHELVTDLHNRGLMREDRFSHCRTTWLEWETGIREGTPDEQYLALREAEREDMERKRG